MEETSRELNSQLLRQVFVDLEKERDFITECRKLAFNYAKIEHSIVVLSDMKTNKSSVFYGELAVRLDIVPDRDMEEIDTIWENKIFSRFHPDDLIEKYKLELRFFHFLKNKPKNEQSKYQISSIIRMLDSNSNFVPIWHRMFYVADPLGDSFRMSVCLYNVIPEVFASKSFLSKMSIVNIADGEVVLSENRKNMTLITPREKLILSYINNGKSSKEIADCLSISTYTVSRHRQNILEKLRAKNSFEACRIAEKMRLI